ncbi:MAG: TIGR03905 family TSCPD domain-containing protein [Christensenellales bacterium]|jgi:uncharacterized protein (TIGR03905 family)
METYKPKGVCSTLIEFEVENDIITHCKFTNGCRGNTTGVARLVEGFEIHDAIKRLKGIRCRGNTSCPDQLALALEAYLAKRQSA